MTPPGFLTDHLVETASQMPQAPLLACRSAVMTAEQLLSAVRACAAHFQASGISVGDRVAVWLPKQFEAVIAMWAAAHIGAVFIPVNAGLRPQQVKHILEDSGARLLISTHERLAQLAAAALQPAAGQMFWHCDRLTAPTGQALHRPTPDPQRLAAILYTSGSTGRPKGVMLTHANLALGARSVAQYLGISAHDRLLCVLPLSFDYGLNQVTTALLTGAQAVLFDHIFPRDILQAMAHHRITGLAGVPALWTQLVEQDWPEDTARTLRYITNSGGRMPGPVLEKLQALAPKTSIFLMYGLTEAFRSTYLDPARINEKPDSIGRAIPGAEVRVVNAQGQETAPDEVGELVHMGPLVAQGYWNDAERSRERFRPAPACATSVPPGTLSVWSGDRVRRDADGDLFFVGRNDEMIKTSGYRVSPTEVEEILYRFEDVQDAVAVGVADEKLGEVIVAVVAATGASVLDVTRLKAHCRAEMPAYMQPARIIVRPELPRNSNGKLDRSGIAAAVRTGEWS